MTKEQLIQIAKAGFPDRVNQFINFKNCEIHCMGDVFRLYDKDEGIIYGRLPKRAILAIVVEKGFIQFSSGHDAFNHYAAIKEMERMGLV